MALEKIKAAEFYSGIGGMHMALEGTGLPYDVLAAAELNDIANNVYRFNFPETKLLQRNIEGLTLREMELFQANTIVMSPPCQPFTRVGNQKASNDPRTNSFLNIIRILESMQNPPKYILMENVKGFEVSVTRDQFVAVLEKVGFSFQEFLISPKQFGIPNSRLRYYLLAKLKPLKFYFKTSNEPMDSIPTKLKTRMSDRMHDPTEMKLKTPENDLDVETMSATDRFRSDENSDGLQERDVQKISMFLEEPSHELYLTEEILGKLGTVLDIVTPSSTNSCCFTKAYASYVKGTGSVLCTKAEKEIKDAFESVSGMGEADKGKHLLNLGLRYFSAREIANLMCFPKSFGFPNITTKKQQYKLLGNSINVHVVSELMKRCLFTEFT